MKKHTTETLLNFLEGFKHFNILSSEGMDMIAEISFLLQDRDELIANNRKLIDQLEALQAVRRTQDGLDY